MLSGLMLGLLKSLRPHVVRLARRARPLPLPEVVYRHLHFEDEITVPITSQVGFRIRHHGFFVENQLYWGGYGGFFEGTSVVLWAWLARHAHTIVDIGANTGVYALAARAINREARVHAFEPSATVFEHLVANIGLNGGGVEAWAVGVSNATGTATFHHLPGAQTYNASLVADRLSHRPDDIILTSIPVTRMDDFLRDAAPDELLVKVDTELNEPQVVEGFGSMLSTHRPTLLIEILNRDVGRTIERLLEGLDYRYLSILEGEGVFPTEEIGARGRNHLLIHREQAQRLGLLPSGMSHDVLWSRLQGDASRLPPALQRAVAQARAGR